MKAINFHEGEIRDLGFGTKGSSGRLINRDGTFNVKRKGHSKLNVTDMYDVLISMSFQKFFIVILLSYVLINLFFASLYLLTGMQNLVGITGENNFELFLEAFSFSGQTFTTLGYGRINPVGFWTNTLAVAESAIGLLFFTLIGGFFYGRFSRPVARILYSRSAVIAPYRGITALQFRIANQRRNQLIELDVEVIFASFNPETGLRQFSELALERSKLDFLPLSWTIVHPVNESSPLHGISKEKLKACSAEFIVLIKAFDDTYSHSIFSRTSYVADEIIWGKRFIDMQDRITGNSVNLDLHMLHDIEDAALPEKKSN